jgi:outer membrane immunogenic protein
MRAGLAETIAAVVLTATTAGAGDLYRGPPPPLGPCGPAPCAPPAPPAGPCGLVPCAPPPCGPAPCGPPYAPAPIPYWYSWNWTGPYMGANLGFQWGSLSNSGASPSGVAGGFQGGYNWQFGQIVTGFEADIQLSDANGVFANYKFSNPWFGTVRGRGGVAVNNLLFYGTLGLAYGGGRVDIGTMSESNLHAGWTTGVGLEVGVTPSWSVKAEYLFIDLFSRNYTLTQTNNGLTSSVARFGVNYRF